ncbi:MAG: sialate O-acetylesterase [Deltaproteobacteria bacterium]|nr:sialate O-acetylesterase [Deltaproteobacteria bacterium]
MDIFLLMGQSNMAGRGLLDDVEPIRDERIRVFQDGRWAVAEEPLHHDRPTAGIGLAMSFARSVLDANPGTDVGLVPRAVGSTPLERWMPGADLYEGAVAAAREAAKDGAIKAVLWHQGEHDSKSEADAASYGRRFTGMATTLRERLGAPSLPVILGELGGYLSKRPDFPHYRTVNTELRKIPDILPHSAFVNAEGLTDKGDDLHYDARSLRIFGERYAAAYLAMQH